MQLQQIDSGDRVTSLIKIRTSSIFETLLSLQSVVHPWRHQDWTEEAERVLGSSFIEETSELYNKFRLGCDFTELVFGYNDNNDFNGFLDYFNNLSLKEMAFHILGRIYPREIIPDNITVESLGKMAAEYQELEISQHIVNFTWAEDSEAFKAKLFRIWSTYWNDFFSSRVSECSPYWFESLKEKEEIFNLDGGTALIEDICSHKKIPDPFPADMPYKEIVIIPVYRSTRNCHMFYGYGNVTILYDCRRTKAVVQEINREKQKTLQVIRALSDENRLRILKLIADVESMYNGKRISEKIGLSPSVVSRHLSQLRDAGIISEQSVDNRNITYTLNREVISQIPLSLLRYLNE